MSEVVLRIVTGRERQAVGGGDSVILVMPGKLYLEVDGKPTLAVQALGKFLRQMAEKQAGDLGETLHHAEFVVTSDPAVVRRRGIMPQHDGCEDCEAGLQRGLRHLEDFPADELLVGHLYWASD